MHSQISLSANKEHFERFKEQLNTKLPEFSKNDELVEAGFRIIFPNGVAGARKNKREKFLYSTLDSYEFDSTFQKQLANCNEPLPEPKKGKSKGAKKREK